MSTDVEWLIPVILGWIGLMVLILGAVRAGARNDAVVDATLASQIHAEEDALLELEALRSPSGTRFFPCCRSRRMLAAALVGLKLDEPGLGCSARTRGRDHATA